MLDGHLKFPADGLGLDNYDAMIAWLTEHRDLGLFHEMATGLFLETPFGFDYLLWIVRQVDCDRATAAAAFVRSEAYRNLYEEYDARSVPIAEEVCAGAASGRYGQSQFPDPSPLLDTSLAEAHSRIEAGRVAMEARGEQLRFQEPVSLLTSPFSSTPYTPRYLVEQDYIVRIDTLDERAQWILRNS